HTVKIAGKQGGLIAAGAGADLDDQAVEALTGVDEKEILESLLQGVAARAQAGPFLLDEGSHLGIGLVGEEGLGLLEGLADRLVFEVGLDASGEGTVLPGDARKAAAVGDNGGVGELLFQLLVSAQGLLEDG